MSPGTGTTLNKNNMSSNQEIVQIKPNPVFKTTTCKKIDITIINSEYDQEILQSQTADIPMAPRGIATQQIRGTRKTN